VIDRRFELRSGQTKDYEIDICCFFAKNAALRRYVRKVQRKKITNHGLILITQELKSVRSLIIKEKSKYGWLVGWFMVFNGRYISGIQVRQLYV
jgi:hypothetical protein